MQGKSNHKYIKIFYIKILYICFYICIFTYFSRNIVKYILHFMTHVRLPIQVGLYVIFYAFYVGIVLYIIFQKSLNSYPYEEIKHRKVLFLNLRPKNMKIIKT